MSSNPRCVHGLDSRFCSLCNTTTQARRLSTSGSAIASTTLAEILEFLNAEKVRATYGAVGQLLGVIPRSLGALLGHRQAEASWIVNAATGLPTDYTQHEMHPDLLHKGEIIGTGNELMWRLAAWRAERSK